MRKLRYLIGTCIVGICAITASAFAYFNFSSHSSESKSASTDSDYINNIEFDQNSTLDDDRTYTLYFFASPYYATGIEDISSGYSDSLMDPLEICALEDNPYNDDESYCITSMNALSESEEEYANFESTSTSGETSYRYISTPSYDPTSDNYDGNKLTTISKTYTKADFSGTLNISQSLRIDNDDLDDEHTYLKLTVTGGITTDILNEITAETVFKNRYGFGPTFMGWTYDKEECFNRTTYKNYSNTYYRYLNDNTLGITDTWNEYKMCNVSVNDGNATITSESVDQIGNYGSDSTISLLSADDSLYEIDNKGLDGTEKEDKVIYLYPVYADQKFSTSTSDVKAPILKMLSNPDIDESSKTYYKYHQEGEQSGVSFEDRTDIRTADYFNYDSSVTISTSANVTKPNYTLNGFHVDQKKENGNYYLLEVLLTNDYNMSYQSSWIKLFDNSELESLFKDKSEYFQNYVSNYEGTFDIDIIFSKTDFSFSKFENDELYINTPSKNTLIVDDAIVGYYVIGLRRNNSLKITGLKGKTDYASILDYSSQPTPNQYLYKTSIVYNEDSSSSGDSSYWHYFTSNPIQLDKGQKISTMIKDALTIKDTYDIDQFQRMTSGVLGYYNNILTSSDVTNKTEYVSSDKKGKLTATREEVTASVETTTTTIENFPTITCSVSGTYELLVAVKYSNGFPKQIQVAYREFSTVCNLLVLSEKPDVNSDGKYVYSSIINDYSNSILLKGEFSIGYTISKDTNFGGNKFSKVDKDIDSSKELYDLASGEPVRKLIQNGEFILSRNMILYYADK